MIYILLLVLLFIIIIMFGLYKKAEIQFSPVVGFMVGSLISWEHYEDGIDYTLQCCLGFISLTVLWSDQIDG